MKKMLLFVIDSLHPIALSRIFKENKAPALRFLAEHGKYIPQVISSFPTMTPVATSSLITGSWPDQHRIPGFIWYDDLSGEIVDYGATLQGVWKFGPEKILRNLLFKLNQEHLNPLTPTVYEILEAGGYTTGNINLFMHRAGKPYLAKIPLLLDLASGFRLRQETVFGPSELTLGQLVHPPFHGCAKNYPRGILHRFGFNDAYAAQIACRLIREKKQPDFMVVYFPDNDKYSHRHGPLRTGPAIELADRQVASILHEYGSWEKAVDENAVIVTGDHAQSEFGSGRECLIDLDQALKPFRRLKAGEKGSPASKEIVICPNERMAFIYLLQGESGILSEVLSILAKDPRNAQIAWKVSGNKYSVLQGGTAKRLSFSRGGQFEDIYGQSWSLEGDLTVIDAQINGERNIVFGRYPDAFNRLSSALEVRSGSRVVVSAAPGYEYLAAGAPIHPGGGSHGSLEAEDSTVPAIIAGMPINLDNVRIIDFVPLILGHFGLNC